ncbi:MAG: MFS transporter [Pikeienuella sp.]
MTPRYWSLFGGCLTQFTIIGLLVSYGVLVKALEAEFGWSRTLLSGAASLSTVMMGVFAIAGGRLTDRFGPRIVLTVTGLCYGFGYCMLAYVSAPWQLFAIFGVLLAMGLGTHDVVTLSTIARWFQARRGIMSGVVKVGTAVGQMSVPPLMALLFAWYGWRDATLALGVGATVLLVIAAQSMSAPQVDKVEGVTAPPQSGISFQDAKRGRIFWTICVMQLLFFPTMMTIPLHIVPHGMDLGMTAPAAAVLITSMGAASIFGRLVVGAFADKIGGRNAYVLCLTPVIIGLCLLIVVREPWLILLVMALYGFGHGGLFTVVSPTVAEMFGMRAHGAIFGVVLFCGTIGGAIGPVVAGWVFDVTGGYDFAFAGLAVLALLCLLLGLTLPGRHAPGRY